MNLKNFDHFFFVYSINQIEFFEYDFEDLSDFILIIQRFLNHPRLARKDEMAGIFKYYIFFYLIFINY